MWSDSQVVLHWLHRENSPTTFVKNRVKQKTEFNKKYAPTWHYCPTKDNPVDMLTKETNFQTFVTNELWFDGPCWIKDTQLWPTWSPVTKVVETAQWNVFAQSTEDHESCFCSVNFQKLAFVPRDNMDTAIIGFSLQRLAGGGGHRLSRLYCTGRRIIISKHYQLANSAALEIYLTPP